MHELGIANSVLEAVRTEATRHPRTYPSKVGLRIGELAAIDADALRFCFETIIHETDLQALQLEVEICPCRWRCAGCKYEFAVRDYDHHCPKCGDADGECISGDELLVAYIEVEEYEPSVAGAKST